MSVNEMPANMGIKDKKAIRAATETMEEALANFKSVCGNAELNSEIDWASWGAYDYGDMSGNRDRDEVILNAGTLMSDVIGEMAELCDDEDYKEELANITLVSISGKEDQSSMYVDFELDGTTLKMALNADAYGSWKNKDLLKEVWG